MKKQYSTPNLTTHGSVEEITQLFGDSGNADFLFFNGNPASANGQPISSHGSIDGDLDVTNPSNPVITPRQ